MDPNTIVSNFRYAAKAVAAFVAPFVALALVAFLQWVNLDVFADAIDPSEIEQWLVALILAAGQSFAVWLKTNGPKPNPREVP